MQLWQSINSTAPYGLSGCLEWSVQEYDANADPSSRDDDSYKPVVSSSIMMVSRGEPTCNFPEHLTERRLIKLSPPDYYLSSGSP
jgi:hypothetical protein